MSSVPAATAYVGLGANLGDPRSQIEAAVDALAAVPGILISAVSRLYRSHPVGPSGQPDYCNAACALTTVISPFALLGILHKIEADLGRVRSTERWGPRTLDLDLLHVEGIHSTAATLRLPHPELGRRNFVLIPLAEIAPDLIIPGLGSVAERARNIGSGGLSFWVPPPASGVPGSQGTA